MGSSVRKPPAAAKPTAYRADPYTWSLEQAALLRAGRFLEIDAPHIAEEIDDAGRAQYDKLESALRLTLQHLLKWDHQAARRSRSWALTVRTQRRRLENTLRKNPGLKAELAEAVREAYADAVDDAALETGLSETAFPSLCPYSMDDILRRPVEWPDAAELRAK